MLSTEFYKQNSERLYGAEKEFLKATFEEGKGDKVLEAVRNAVQNSSKYYGMDKNYRSILSAFSIALNHTHDMVRRIGGILYCEPFLNCLSILDKEETTQEDVESLQNNLKKAAVANKKKAMMDMGV